MFTAHDQEHFDDALLVLGMIALVSVFLNYVPIRASISWAMPLSGGLSYSVLTLTCDAAGNCFARCVQPYRDGVTIILLNFVLFVTWYGSAETEQSRRQQFLESSRKLQRVAARERFLKSYDDAWVILSDQDIVESSSNIEDMLGFTVEGIPMTDLLVARDRLYFKEFLAELQLHSSCQAITVIFETQEAEHWRLKFLEHTLMNVAHTYL